MTTIGVASKNKRHNRDIARGASLLITPVYIGEIEGVKIEFKGEQLNQDDHDTLVQLVKMARHKVFGDDVSVPVNEVLRGLGRHTHKSQRQQLCNEVDRLVSGTLRFTPKGLPS